MNSNMRQYKQIILTTNPYPSAWIQKISDHKTVSNHVDQKYTFNFACNYVPVLCEKSLNIGGLLTTVVNS